MTEASPLHSQLPKRGAGHVTRCCEEEDTRHTEAHSQPPSPEQDSEASSSLNTSGEHQREVNQEVSCNQDTPSDYCTPDTCNGGSSPRYTVSDGHETVITFSYPEEGAWETGSETSTPDFKRGRHRSVKLDENEDRDSRLTKLAIEEILQNAAQPRGPLSTDERLSH